MKKNLPKNKRAWVKIVEAFLSIMLIIGVMLIILSSGYVTDTNSSERAYQEEVSVLREIQLNRTLRGDIIRLSPPVSWNNFPQNLKDKINETQGYTCEAKICSFDAECELDYYPDKNIYSQAVLISTDFNTYSPRQLRIFCWEE